MKFPEPRERLSMELFELVLILFACVIASSIVAQIVSRVSLPLVQIGIGLAVALVLPGLGDVQVESELFLVLFIAPLLFNEAHEIDKRALRKNIWPILSMAIALVLVTVLAMGFLLHLVEPSIPLAVAFACAAALGPTDAAAVSALGSTVSLSDRQKILLSGEALINDASGVVSFQFAIAAAVTGAFSLVQAGESFAVLFFGGIAAGIVMGAIALGSMRLVRSQGLENTIVRVLYEILTPFVVFLAAEALGVSGILAVVAAGLVMARPQPKLVSTASARYRMVASSLWEVLVFLINGIVFVLLGMQLPLCIRPILSEGMNPAVLFGLIVMMTAVIIGIRFLWLFAMELFHADPQTVRRGTADKAAALKDALVTTIAGPKGAVTLSIIMTIPYYTEAGTAFPARDLVIFLTAGTILATLLLADTVLPLLARKPESAEDEADAKAAASVRVLTATIEELQEKIASGTKPEYEPATRLTIARYRTRLASTRLAREGCGDAMSQLIDEVLEAQQKRADEIQSAGHYSAKESAPYYAALRGIRSSVGYYSKGERVGSRMYTLRGRLALLHARLHPQSIDTEKAERLYYDTCLFAIDLENTAIDYLKPIAEGEDQRARIAQTLLEEHESALASLWGRINFGQENPQEPTRNLEHGMHDTMPEGMASTYAHQFEEARRYADAVDEGALSIELDQIRQLREEGTISERIARELREDVYLLQMQLQEG